MNRLIHSPSVESGGTDPTRGRLGLGAQFRDARVRALTSISHCPNSRSNLEPCFGEVVVRQS